MKTIIVTLTLILALAGIVTAGEYVSPYFRSDGTLVQGHYRSSADDNQRTSGYPGTLNAPTNYRNIYR